MGQRVTGSSSTWIPQWSTVSYNVLSLGRSGRLEQISKYYAKHIVRLQGASLPMSQASCQSRVTKYHPWYMWGKRPSPSEKYAGVAIGIPPGMVSKSQMLHIGPVPIHLQGRVGYLCIKQPSVDLFIMVVYQHVEPHLRKQRTACMDVVSFVNRALSQIGNRCLPIILTDGNGRMGLTQTAAGWVLPPDDAVGILGAQPTNHNGRLWHDMLVEQHMCAINTFWSPCPTWYGRVDNVARIDYSFIPQYCKHKVVSCYTD